MYVYETGIPVIDREYGGLRAATNILILAPPLTYAEHLAYWLACPRTQYFANFFLPLMLFNVFPSSFL